MFKHLVADDDIALTLCLTKCLGNRCTSTAPRFEILQFACCTVSHIIDRPHLMADYSKVSARGGESAVRSSHLEKLLCTFNAWCIPSVHIVRYCINYLTTAG